MIGIVLPVYISKRPLLEFLEPLLYSIKVSDKYCLFIVENYVDPDLKADYLEILDKWFVDRRMETDLKLFKVLYPKGEQAVSKAWNQGIREAVDMDCKYIAVLNLDTILAKDCLDKLIAFGEKFPEDIILWTGNDILNKDLTINRTLIRNSFQPDFSCFMVRNNFIEITKGFDENFAPYGDDDWDMFTRIEVMGLRAQRVMDAHYYHAGSQTAKYDEDFRNYVPPTHNRERFVRKWGNPPGLWGTGVYNKHPFNNPELGVNDW